MTDHGEEWSGEECGGIKMQMRDGCDIFPMVRRENKKGVPFLSGAKLMRPEPVREHEN